MGSRDTNLTKQLADELSKFYYDPLGYVMFCFPWTTDSSIQIVKLAEGPDDRNRIKAEERGEPPPSLVLTDADRQRQVAYRERFPNCKYGPDLWACDFLDDLGDQIVERGFDGRNAVDPIQYATASGHGIGKSVLVAWLVKFILDTRPFSKGVVTAGTADQLKTKTWAEVGKWHRLSLTATWFNYTSGRGAMALTHRKNKETWRCDAQTCREENSESFAGLHAASATPFFIFDEGSGVPDKIYEVRDGGTTDGEPMIFDFGNPTRNSGRFHSECAGKLRHRYRVRCIDSREVAITNKDRIQQWVDDYGEESDYVKVRVRGVFPSAGAVQFIGTASVEEAQQRELIEDRYSRLVLGVDVARFGDDESVIYPRRGDDARSFPPRRFRGLDLIQLSGKIIETVREFRLQGLEVVAIFVDGTGVGGGVVDYLRHLGYNIIEVQFGSSPVDSLMYRYKSDEMWGNMSDAIKTRLRLPGEQAESGNDLKQDLTMREFGYTLTGNKIHLETKKMMKERGITSPDLADALALTFAEEVAPTDVPAGLGNETSIVQAEYDPLDQTW